MATPEARPAPSARGAVTSRAPLEVAPPPILAKVEALLKEGKESDAIRLAYTSAVEDLRRAFGLKLPRQWTHREFIAKYLRADMGYLVVLFPRLYAMYEPVRYGRPAPASGAQLMELMNALYKEPAFRRLSWTIGADATPLGRGGATRAGSASTTSGVGAR
jgi:hypothetical protein